MKTKQFIVASVSTNTNSFGLRGVILVARDGSAFEVGQAYPPDKGKLITVAVDGSGHVTSSAQFTFEIPRRLPLCPPKGIDMLFRNAELYPESLEVGQGYFIPFKRKSRIIRNLRPIMDYARKSFVDKVSITGWKDGSALLHVEFFDKSKAALRFASFGVCKNFVKTRRTWCLKPENLTIIDTTA